MTIEILRQLSFLVALIAAPELLANTPAVPGPLAGSAACLDASSATLVLFGGRRDGVERRETWLRSGTEWRRVVQEDGPCARFGHAMVWDSSRACVVLFGGRANGRELGDTWEWHGGRWHRRASERSPCARRLHAMAFDPARGRVVLFGGVAHRRGMLADTWEWDGKTWTEVRRASTTATPPRRIRHAMSYDASRRTVLLFGGYGRKRHLRDTWAFDGSAWVLLSRAEIF